MLNSVCLLVHSFIHSPANLSSTCNFTQNITHPCTEQNWNENKPNKNGLLFYLRKCTLDVLDTISYCLQGFFFCPFFSSFLLYFFPWSAGSQSPSRGVSGGCVRTAASTLKTSPFCHRWPFRGPLVASDASQPYHPQASASSFMARGCSVAYPLWPFAHLQTRDLPLHSELEDRRWIWRKLLSKLCPVSLLVIWVASHHLLHTQSLPTMVLAVEDTNPLGLSSEYFCHCAPQWPRLCLCTGVGVGGRCKWINYTKARTHWLVLGWLFPAS